MIKIGVYYLLKTINIFLKAVAKNSELQCQI
jgi:hypothetical protein